MAQHYLSTQSPFTFVWHDNGGQSLPENTAQLISMVSENGITINIADNVTITGMSMVTKSISEAGSYSSGTPMLESLQWKRAAVRFKQLADVPLTQLMQRLDYMKSQIESLESTKLRNNYDD